MKISGQRFMLHNAVNELLRGVLVMRWNKSEIYSRKNLQCEGK